jgi:hypothetical protein
MNKYFFSSLFAQSRKVAPGKLAFEEARRHKPPEPLSPRASLATCPDHDLANPFLG